MMRYRTWLMVLAVPLAVMAGYGVYLASIFGPGTLPSILGFISPPVRLAVLVCLLIVIASPVLTPFATRPAGRNAEVILRALAAMGVLLGIVGALATESIGQTVMNDGAGTLALPSPTRIQTMAVLGVGLFTGFAALECAALAAWLRRQVSTPSA